MNKAYKFCYNCGCELNSTNSTVEHIPAKNLFKGFKKDIRKPLITVPACFNCNQLYSKTDQHIRDMLAVDNEDCEKLEFTEKGFRSVMKHSKGRVLVNSVTNDIGVTFSYEELKQLHIKNFKGIFFKEYNFPIPENFDIDIIADDEEQNIAFGKRFYDYLIEDKRWQVSGHEDIFKYIIKDMTLDANHHIYESKDFSKLFIILSIQVYHNNLVSLVIACKKDYLDELKLSVNKTTPHNVH